MKEHIGGFAFPIMGIIHDQCRTKYKINPSLQHTIPIMGNVYYFPVNSHDVKCRLKPIIGIQYTGWEMHDSQDAQVTWCVFDISH